MSQQPPTRVFVSYKWETTAHNEWAKRLATDLRKAGIEAILDDWEVRLGDSFTQYMTTRIQRADAFLFVITSASVAALEAPGAGGALKFEMQIASARKIAGEAMRVIPIYREGSATPTYLRDHRYIDFRDDDKYSQRLSQLIDDLLGRNSPPPLGRLSSSAPEDYLGLIEPTERLASNSLNADSQDWFRKGAATGLRDLIRFWFTRNRTYESSERLSRDFPGVTLLAEIPKMGSRSFEEGEIFRAAAYGKFRRS